MRYLPRCLFPAIGGVLSAVLLTVLSSAMQGQTVATGAAPEPVPAAVAPAVGATTQRLLLQENFDNGLEGMWVEGGYRTWVENGSLYIDADGTDGKDSSGVATVWFAQMMPAEVQIEFDAEVISSSINANNINFFLNYSHPSGKSLYETREERASGAYNLYHNLNGYIVTFLNDRTVEGGIARVRLRRCPGFKLIEQSFGGRCDAGVVYRCKIVNKGGTLSFYVDGRLVVSAEDEAPLGEGLIGIRTFKTLLRIDNLRVSEP